MYVFLALVAKERHNLPQARLVCPQLAGREQVGARTRADKQPMLAGQPAYFGDRGATVDSHDLVDQGTVPGDDARDEPVRDPFDQVPTHLPAHQRARLAGLHGDHPARRVAGAETLAHPGDRAAVPTRATTASGTVPAGSWASVSGPSQVRFSSTFHSESNCRGAK
jgi:hypothetical protein